MNTALEQSQGMNRIFSLILILQAERGEEVLLGSNFEGVPTAKTRMKIRMNFHANDVRDKAYPFLGDGQN